MPAKRHMTDQHKAALVQGREAGRIVRSYLAALEAKQPRRGRKLPLATLQTRLNETNQKISTETDPLRRLQLVQQRLDLTAAIERQGNSRGPDSAALEKEFIKHAKSYGASKGISYAAWREVGVQPSVLKAAGIGRGA